MRSWRLALFVCLLIAGVQAVAAVAYQSGGAQPGPLALAAGEHPLPSTRSALIGRLPFGLSIEYPVLERALGAGPCPSEALISTFRELGSPPLRIGGDSQDLAGPSVAYHYFVPASFWTALGCFARETKSQITVGLNFGDGTLADERAMIAAAEQAIPPTQLSFSLGNEPDLYGIRHVLHNEPSFTVPVLRPGGWSASAYARQWVSRRSMLGPIRLEGPDLATNSWRGPIAQLLRENPPDEIDAHIYPTSACRVGPPATRSRLLSRHASVGVVSERAWLVAAAQAVHRPAIISESNSASCGGKPGLSDTPVASVWAVRFVLAALLEGFQQVRFHSAGTSYDPFVFNADGTLTRRPLAGALLFLAHWIPIGSRITSTANTPQLLAVTVSDKAGRSMIVSSFSSHTLELPIKLGRSASHLATDTLTTTSAVNVYGSVPVKAHRAELRLAPSTVVAFRTR